MHAKQEFKIFVFRRQTWKTATIHITIQFLNLLFSILDTIALSRYCVASMILSTHILHPLISSLMKEFEIWLWKITWEDIFRTIKPTRLWTRKICLDKKFNCNEKFYRHILFKNTAIYFILAYYHIWKLKGRLKTYWLLML